MLPRLGPARDRAQGHGGAGARQPWRFRHLPRGFRLRLDREGGAHLALLLVLSQLALLDVYHWSPGGC